MNYILTDGAKTIPSTFFQNIIVNSYSFHNLNIVKIAFESILKYLLTSYV